MKLWSTDLLTGQMLACLLSQQHFYSPTLIQGAVKKQQLPCFDLLTSCCHGNKYQTSESLNIHNHFVSSHNRWQHHSQFWNGRNWCEFKTVSTDQVFGVWKWQADYNLLEVCGEAAVDVSTVQWWRRWGEHVVMPATSTGLTNWHVTTNIQQQTDYVIPCLSMTTV